MNIDKLRSLNSPITKYISNYKTSKANSNMIKEKELVNSSIGTIQDILFEEGQNLSSLLINNTDSIYSTYLRDEIPHSLILTDVCLSYLSDYELILSKTYLEFMLSEIFSSVFSFERLKYIRKYKR
ncbi:hypothetical protein BC936DRAFT_149699, partial [Jimgerdemannia flammicorona]